MSDHENDCDQMFGDCACSRCGKMGDWQDCEGCHKPFCKRCFANNHDVDDCIASTSLDDFSDDADDFT
jgi:hypothetical protein